MAFIPNHNILAPGTRVRLLHDIEALSGTFTRGHSFTVYSTGDRGPNLVDSAGRKLGEMGLHLDSLRIIGFGPVPEVED
jgi:hypothetical protein